MNTRRNGEGQRITERATAHQQTLAFAEGIVRLVLAVIVVFLIIWLIVVDPVLSSNAQVGVKALMAFSFAALMSSMAGLIEVKGKHLGWVIRAAGGAAIFIIVWFTLPKIIGNLERQAIASLAIGKLSAFDIRSMKPPSPPSTEHGEAGVAITVPMDLSATSGFDRSLPAILRGAQVSLSLGKQGTKLPWQYFVRQVPFTAGNWLSADPIENAHAVEISVGTPVKREVLFASSPGDFSWKTFVTSLNEGSGLQLTVVWDVTDAGGDRTVVQGCSASGRAERSSVDLMLKEGALPSRIVFQCGT